ncbi:MAG: hypothetical protein H8E25_12730 [Planctomycetes bacterium]|nr:hypothetical protein [Planctomycetota bacterium]
MTELASQKPKSSTLKWVMVAAGYLSLITFMAYMSIGKAIDKSQEMGDYQIQQTLIYQGADKAQRLREWRNERMGVEDQPSADLLPTDNAATDTPKK